jgi:hypothetical protein
MSTVVIVDAELERELWTRAWRINMPGASNPVGVARTLAEESVKVLHAYNSTQAVREHKALRAMAAHLAFLFGHGLGPDGEVLNELVIKAEQYSLNGD